MTRRASSPQLALGRKLGVRVSHTGRSTRLALCIGGRQPQPDVWHTVARPNIQHDEATLLIAILKAGCAATGVTFQQLSESMNQGKVDNVLATEPHHVDEARARAAISKKHFEAKGEDAFARFRAAQERIQRERAEALERKRQQQKSG